LCNGQRKRKKKKKEKEEEKEILLDQAVTSGKNAAQFKEIKFSGCRT
jgi:hypothetical protein